MCPRPLASPLLALLLAALVGCAGEQKVNPVDDSGADDSGPIGHDSGDSGDTGDTAPPFVSDADLVIDPSLASTDLIGWGAQIWPADSAWTGPLDDLEGNLVRLPWDPGLDDPDYPLPEDATAEEWDAWLDEYIYDLSPTFLDDLQTTREATDGRNIDWIVHHWGAPEVWTTDGALDEAHIIDLARLIGASVGYLVDRDLAPRYLELLNEPDGDWNTYVLAPHYDALVVAVRQDLDARGLVDVGIVGPGLSVLGGYGVEPEWVPLLSEEAVVALEAWSVHTWDDYAEDGEGHLFLDERWDIFLGQVEARDADKPILVTEMGSKDTVFDGITYGSPDPDACGRASESDGYAVRLLAHTALALSRGADGLVYWQAADQGWECSRWGLYDEDGEARRFGEALADFWMGAPANAGVVAIEDPELAAAALVSGEAAMVLLVNDGVGEVVRTVGFAERGWALDRAGGFGVEDRTLRDELIDLSQARGVTGTVAIDSDNDELFNGDPSRVMRAAAGEVALDWSVPGELEHAEVVAWSWEGEDAVLPTLYAASDGATWTEIEGEVSSDLPGWERHRVVARSFPPGSRWLRVVIPDTSAELWNPQVGDLTLRFTPDTRGSLPDPAETDVSVQVRLMPGSAAFLRFKKE